MNSCRRFGDAFVDESKLSQSIFVLRKALGKRASENRYVATIPERGYTFVASVREAPELIEGATKITVVNSNESRKVSYWDASLTEVLGGAELVFTLLTFAGQTTRRQVIADIQNGYLARPILAVEGLPGSEKTFAASEFLHNRTQGRTWSSPTSSL